MSAAPIHNPEPAHGERAAGPAHLYAHVPFCARICPYCAFYKEQAAAADTERFCDALLSELDLHRQRWTLRPRTIFFGGGTPSALSTAQLAGVLEGFRARLDLSQLEEWTFEANPGSVSERKAAVLRAGGVTRISLGVQSWNDRTLGLLGREHDAARAEASFHLFRRAGFPSINIDLMFGVPSQTLADWIAGLERTIALGPDHISAYCLTYEEDTEFFLRHARGELRENTDADAEFFEAAERLLEAAGYRHYETSNYARPGFESVHNAAYWAGADYLGLGPSAFSTVGARRWQNVADFRAYHARLTAGESLVAGDEALTPAMKRGEVIALSLRTRDGVPRAWLESRAEETEEFVGLGLLHEIGGRYVLTASGRLMADTVAAAYV